MLWYQVRKGHDQITQQDFIDVLDKQLFEGMGVVLMDQEQKKAEQKVFLSVSATVCERNVSWNCGYALNCLFYVACQSLFSFYSVL